MPLRGDLPRIQMLINGFPEREIETSQASLSPACK